MLSVPIILSDRLLLRLANLEDIPEILNYYSNNQVYLTPYYPRWQEDFFTAYFWQQRVKQNIDEFRSDRSLKLFLFKRNNSNLVIGSVNFSNFVRGAGQFCSLGYSIAESQQGKGLMTEALQVAISYVFDELHFHRIQANYLPHNLRSGRLLRRLGFVVEGYAKNYLLINDRWEDHILTSLVNPSEDTSSSIITRLLL